MLSARVPKIGVGAIYPVLLLPLQHACDGDGGGNFGRFVLGVNRTTPAQQNTRRATATAVSPLDGKPSGTAVKGSRQGHSSRIDVKGNPPSTYVKDIRQGITSRDSRQVQTSRVAVEAIRQDRRQGHPSRKYVKDRRQVYPSSTAVNYSRQGQPSRTPFKDIRQGHTSRTDANTPVKDMRQGHPARSPVKDNRQIQCQIQPTRTSSQYNITPSIYLVIIMPEEVLTGESYYRSSTNIFAPVVLWVRPSSHRCQC